MRFLKFFAGLTFSLFAVLAHAQSACELVSLADVEKQFPAYGPWKLNQGGVGACSFEGVIEYERRSYMMVLLKINLQFKANAAEASKFVKMMATTMATPNNLTKSASLGEDGFFYQPKSGTKDAIWWVARDDKAVSMGTFMVQAADELSKEDIRSLTEVIRLGLRSSKNKGMAEKTATCPYFDRNAVNRLFENTTAKIEQYGENSCLASAKENKAALVFSRLITDSPEQAQMMAKASTGGGCTVETTAELGASGAIAYACSGGRPRAELLFTEGNAFIRISYTSEKEPSVTQRKNLLGLGLFARQQLGKK